MTYKQKLILLVTVASIFLLVIAGLIINYFRPDIFEGVSIVPVVEDERLVLQHKLDSIVDFSFVSEEDSLELILNSSEYQQIKTKLFDQCNDDNLNSYLSCPRAFFYNQYLLKKIQQQVPSLFDEDRNTLSLDIMRINNDYAVPPFELVGIGQIIATPEVLEIVEAIEKNTQLSLFKIDQPNNLLAQPEFRSWLEMSFNMRSQVCSVPISQDVKEDCIIVMDPYLSSMFYNFFFADQAEKEVQQLVNVVQRGAHKESAELQGLNQQVLEGYARNYLSDYVNQMKSKYAALDGQVEDLTEIKEFLLEPMDSPVYNIGKHYYYVNYLNVGRKSESREQLNQEINNLYKETAQDLGFTNEEMRSFIISQVGDEEAIIDILIKLYNDMNRKYTQNILAIDESSDSFIFYSGLVDQVNFDKFVNILDNKDEFLKNLEEYRFYTYLLLYLDDNYKSKGSRTGAFNEKDADGFKMQHLFKFSRYTDRQSINDFVSSFQ